MKNLVFLVLASFGLFYGFYIFSLSSLLHIITGQSKIKKTLFRSSILALIQIFVMQERKMTPMSRITIEKYKYTVKVLLAKKKYSRLSDT